MNIHHRTLPDRFIWLSDPHWYPGCPHKKRLAGIVEDAFPNPTFFGGDSLEAHAGVKYKDRPDWFDPEQAVKGNHDDDILPKTIPDAIYDKKKRLLLIHGHQRDRWVSPGWKGAEVDCLGTAAFKLDSNGLPRLGNVERLFRDWGWEDKMFDVMADVGATTCLAGHTHKFGITIRRGRRLAVGGARGTPSRPCAAACGTTTPSSGRSWAFVRRWRSPTSCSIPSSWTSG